MDSPYHSKDHFRAIFRSGYRHFRMWKSDPAYRALIRFNRRLRSTPRFSPAKLDYHGNLIYIADKASFLSAWDEIFVNRIYEIETQSSNPKLVDLGANIGLAPLFWSTKYPNFRYTGFEPDSNIARICRQNLQSWGCAGVVHNLAVNSTGSPVKFERDGADGGRISNSGESPNTVYVDTIRLSEILTDDVDLLKVDIEGPEAEVLAEARNQLPFVRNIFVEMHSRPGRPQTWSDVLQILKEAGFVCYMSVLRAPSRPFLDPQSDTLDFDHLVNVFGVRRGLDQCESST